MRQIVLYLEDDANMRRYTAEQLRERGYDVEDFRRIDQVKEFFPANKDKIVCVIADLNMADQWLGEWRHESDGGMLSGWVWLQRFVYPKKPDMPTVIYSGYIPLLKDRLQTEGKLSLLERGNIAYVEKGDGEWEGFGGLLRTLKEKLHIEPCM